MNTLEWKNRDIFYTYGKDFCMEIVHWVKSYGANAWNIYVYLYSDHPTFDKVDLTAFYPEVEEISWHGGCTFMEVIYNRDGTKKRAIKLGCDYCHYGDERFEAAINLAEAPEVLADANRIFQKLQEIANAPR